jgi:hypothetical protein
VDAVAVDEDDGVRPQPPADAELAAARRRLDELTSAYGPEDERVVATVEGLAMRHYARQETAEALPLMRRVVGSRPAADSAALRSRRMLSTLLQRSGQHAEALVEHDRVVAATVAAAGAESRAALASRHNHAVLLRESGDGGGAQSLFTDVAEQAARVLGPEDIVARAAAAAAAGRDRPLG